MRAHRPTKVINPYDKMKNQTLKLIEIDSNSLAWSVENLPRQAVGIRPIEIVDDELVLYTGMLFPDAEQLRALLTSMINNGQIHPDGILVLDLITSDGDVIDDFPLTESGLRFLSSDGFPENIRCMPQPHS